MTVLRTAVLRTAARRTATRRASAAGLALAACLTATPATALAAADRDAESAAGLGRYYHQRLDWRGCVLGPDDQVGRDLEKEGARCADVTVPLDYSDPEGRTITVAISRLKATDTRHRVGPLLLNGGGPGGPALGDPPGIRTAMKEVGARYDVIGMDPRFVGRSTPLDCGWPVGNAIVSAGLSRASFERQVTFQKGLADSCRATNAAVLPHVSTRNTARDMDVIRGALGERKISYLGYSYGTYLGTVYTQMFPGRHDRVVLDGAIDPRRYNPRLMRGVEPENERAFADWAAWAARRHDTYGLGRTREEVLATADRVFEASARRPLTVGTGADRYRLDDTQVPFVVFNGISDDSDKARAALGEQLSVLARAAAGQPTRLSAQFAELLRFALTGAQSHYGSVQTAILCGDVAAPRDPERYWKDIEATRAEHRLVGSLTNNIGPCAFWDRPREEPTRVRQDAPVLIVAATGDPRTPYRGSAALRDLLPSSRLITLEGANHHAVYGYYGNACVDAEVNAYLSTGRLPAKDETCVKPAG
ncbi:alpha/beta hydrolase [Streptomyces sp. NBC_01565]|uniref:alpha/beta hydrolase n=1 Tax=unclassified Streptomyces TaxID=2593676 RepID=UPI00224DC921|nr:alpha/beta hydrolase [Streptomyces sp. NBC_01565]MCX4539476.1 alpha/beta hydrolase [Streptomyces sp. NBC_01565]